VSLLAHKASLKTPQEQPAPRVVLQVKYSILLPDSVKSLVEKMGQNYLSTVFALALKVRKQKETESVMSHALMKISLMEISVSKNAQILK